MPITKRSPSIASPYRWPALPAWPKLDSAERQQVFFALDALWLWAVGTLSPPPTDGALWAALQAAILLFGLHLCNFYAPLRRWSAGQVPFAALKGLALALALLVPLHALCPSPWGLTPALAAELAVGWAGLVGWRWVCFRSFAQLPVRRVALYGLDAPSRQLADEIRAKPQAGFEVVGFIRTAEDGPAEGMEAPAPVLAANEALPALVERHGIDTLIVPTWCMRGNPALLDCLERGVSVMSPPALCEQLAGRIPLAHLDSSWFLYEVRPDNRHLYQAFKRLLDSAIALLGLAFTALLLPALWLGMRCFGGPGPLIYSQTRIGHRGQPFRIYKFRTMRQDAEKGGAQWAAVQDARVTPIGRFLRHSRLDELPQFWNVLKGEMSLVGPRPERPEFVEMLEAQIPFYARRHMLAPGLTGWAQVMFPYGASVEDSAEKLQYDLYYVKNRSFYLDLQIMLRTITVMICKLGSR